MTLKFRFPFLIALAVSAIFLFNPNGAQAASKKAAASSKKAAAKSAPSKASKRGGRETAASRKESRSSKHDSRRERAADNRRGRADRRSSKAERAAERRGKRGRDDDRASSKVSRRDLKRMSRRERVAAARAEAERRRREEAERRRRIAAAIARARAIEQAYKDEARINISHDETTGEDLEVRRAAVSALGDKAGTVVVMNPKTGQVYTVVNQQFALRHGVKPCSTVKLVTGLAGLTENVIDHTQTANISTASYRIDLTDSLAFSDNGYFQRVGGQVGFDKMMEYARRLGLGQPTGINFPAESPGKLPFSKEGYAVNHMSSHGDGIEVTAIQLANMASAIANGGHLLVPHLPRTPEENVRFKREVKRDINIPDDSVQRLVPGMIGSVNYGSGRRAYNPAMTIAGKTGSCREETGNRPWLGLFTSYAPVHDPQLVVTVITHGSSSRGKYSAQIAGQIYSSLRARFGIKSVMPAGLANDMLTPRPKVDPRKAGVESDEDEADKDDAAERAAEDAYVVSESGDNSQQKTNAGQPLLQKTVRTSERPATTTNATPAPAQQQRTTTPAPEQNTNGAQRPRRVSDRP
jgi:membrane peptidoglycan carboxypeptidase